MFRLYKNIFFTFIKMFDEQEPKCKDSDNIIKVINEDKLSKMIKLYIYKIDVFLNPNSIKKYKLDKYSGFSDLKKFPEEEQIHYGLETLDNNNYENIYKTLEKYREDNFKRKIKKEEINYYNLNFDNFYNASNILILSHLQRKDFEKSEISIISLKIYANPYMKVANFQI